MVSEDTNENFVQLVNIVPSPQPLARQAQLNAALDLDKGERQIAEDDRADEPQEAATWQERIETEPVRAPGM